MFGGVLLEVDALLEALAALGAHEHARARLLVDVLELAARRRARLAAPVPVSRLATARAALWRCCRGAPEAALPLPLLNS